MKPILVMHCRRIPLKGAQAKRGKSGPVMTQVAQLATLLDAIARGLEQWCDALVARLSEQCSKVIPRHPGPGQRPPYRLVKPGDPEAFGRWNSGGN